MFRAFLQTSAGALVTTGTTNLYIMELQSDGTIKTYDFNDNTFKTTACTTENQGLTYRKSNNAATDTGLWTAALSTLTGFTVGSIYLARVNNTNAFPTDQMREFQYGSAEGDLVTTANGTGVAELNTDSIFWHGGAIPAPNQTGVPIVDLKYTLGTLSPAVAGYVGIDWGQITNKTSVVDLSGTTIKDLDPGNSILAAISNIAVTGAALNATASSATYTTGTDSGGVNNTFALDGVFDSVAAVGNAIDIYYEFNISGTIGAVGVGATWDGYLVGVVNTIKVYAFNWGGSNWDQIGSIIGIAGTVVSSTEYDLTSAHTGTGANAGKVRIRFAATGLTAGTINTDRILLGYAVVLTPALIATGIFQDTTAGDFTVAGSIGKSLFTGGAVPGAAGGLFIAGTNAATTVTTSFTTTFTGNLTGSVASVANQTIHSGTAVSGSANNIKLDGGASSTTGLYVGEEIVLTGGTGAGQTRTIITYNGSSNQATVDRPFTTAPDNTSTFAILAADNAALNANLQVSVNVAQVAIRTGTLQAGSTSTTAVLDSGASATNGIYDLNLLTITGGTGLGQSQTIAAYNGSTKVATIGGTWKTTPDNTSTFAIYASTSPSQWSEQGVAQAGGASTITLDTAASATNSIYNGSFVAILAGTGAGETGEITAYNGTTKVVTVASAWATPPDSTSVYAVIPQVNNDSSVPIPPPTVQQIASAVWQDATPTDFAVTSSIGKSLYTSGVVPGASGGLFIAGSNATTTVNFTGNLSGSVGSVTGNVGGTINGLTATALANFFTVNSGETYSAAVAGSVVKEIASNVTVVSGAPSAAAIATAVWTDTTGSDFTVSTSPGKIIFTQLGGTFTTTSSSVFSVAALANAPTGGTAPTAAQIATAVWTDTTGSDFATNSSPGKILVTQLGSAFTTASSSVYTAAALANAPTGGSAPTAAQIATQVWTDLTSSADFSTAGSIGALLKADVNAPIGSIPSAAQNATAIWTDLLATSDFSTIGSIGALLKADINAPIGSIPSAVPTAAQIATAVWQDTTSSDFTIASSPGKILVTQLGGVFTTTSSSIYTVAALANAPTGGSAPTVNQIVTGVWTDLLASSDFSTASSIGNLLKNNINRTLTNVQLDLTQVVPRTNTAETIGDCFIAARTQGFGVWRIDPGALTLTLYASDGTTPMRVFNLDSLSAPSYRV